MVNLKGLEQLINYSEKLPDVGWIYVDDSFNIESEQDIKEGNYYIAENDEEDMEMEESMSTFIECPTFLDIIKNQLNHSKELTPFNVLKALVYYLENDDFMD